MELEIRKGLFERCPLEWLIFATFAKTLRPLRFKIECFHNFGIPNFRHFRHSNLYELIFHPSTLLHSCFMTGQSKLAVFSLA